MAETDYDVVVVGAGPAGSTTARFAASTGARVLVLERRREIGVPIQCGEFLPDPDEMQTIVPQASDLRPVFEVPGHLIQADIRGFKVHTPSRAMFVPFKGHSIDRAAYDKYLAGKASDAGAEVLCGTRATGLDRDKVRTTAGDFTAKVIVGADGPHTQVGQWSGLGRPGSLALCMTSQIKGDFPNVMEMHIGRVAPGGYAWVIPKDGCANVGLGIQLSHARRQKSANEKNTLRPLFLRYLKKRFGRVPELDWCSVGLVPYGRPMERTVKDNVILVGDAAGHVMATNGGGVPLAVLCGKLAGETAARHAIEGLPLSEYETRWRQQIEKALMTAVRTKRFNDVVSRNRVLFRLGLSLLGARGMDRAIRCRPLFRP